MSICNVRMAHKPPILTLQMPWLISCSTYPACTSGALLDVIFRQPCDVVETLFLA